MSNVVSFPTKKKPYVDNYFGGCPHCGDVSDCLNVRSDHWFICDTHKTKWCAGSNLFSSWREEDEETWQRNRYRLAGYQKVRPLPPSEPPIGDPAEVHSPRWHIGQCPYCGTIEGVSIVKGQAWAGCVVHEVKWRVSGVTGEEETDREVLHNLRKFDEVEPVRSEDGS